MNLTASFTRHFAFIASCDRKGLLCSVPVVSVHGWSLTWNTLGALTKEARAEDSVAEKIPAEMMGEKPETKLIT